MRRCWQIRRCERCVSIFCEKKNRVQILCADFCRISVILMFFFWCKCLHSGCIGRKSQGQGLHLCCDGQCRQRAKIQSNRIYRQGAVGSPAWVVFSIDFYFEQRHGRSSSLYSRRLAQYCSSHCPAPDCKTPKRAAAVVCVLFPTLCTALGERRAHVCLFSGV